MVMFSDCTVTCPACGHAKLEDMPGSLWSYTCEACGHVMHPPPGGCCVFCAYGDVPCPDIQRGAACSCGNEGA